VSDKTVGRHAAVDLSDEAFEELVRSRRNWGRWGQREEFGALNLVTPEQRVGAMRLIETGEVISLGRPLDRSPGPANAYPVHHYLHTAGHSSHPNTAAVDYIALSVHVQGMTHVDALCHVWDEDGMWGGRDPLEEIGPLGSSWGGIEVWKDQILTRCVLLDIPRTRDDDYVTLDRPVQPVDLEDAAARQGVTLQPGDAIAIYSGREAWNQEHPPWGLVDGRPGLHAACFEFLSDHDISVVLWDMMDMYPTGYRSPWAVHAAINSLGIALVDNCLLEPAAEMCADLGRWEFVIVIAPLVIPGGTGSPVNPLALF
jgi:kynurenine formamidase